MEEMASELLGLERGSEPYCTSGFQLLLSSETYVQHGRVHRYASMVSCYIVGSAADSWSLDRFLDDKAKCRCAFGIRREGLLEVWLGKVRSRVERGVFGVGSGLVLLATWNFRLREWADFRTFEHVELVSLVVVGE